MDDSIVAYLDLTGSGIETVSHVKENGRIEVMFMSFEDVPRILRPHGEGEIVEPVDEEWEELRATFLVFHNSARAIIKVHVYRVATSCGFAVPLMEYKGDQMVLHNLWEERGLAEDQLESKLTSIDGLTRLESVAGKPVEEAVAAARE